MTGWRPDFQPLDLQLQLDAMQEADERAAMEHWLATMPARLARRSPPPSFSVRETFMPDAAQASESATVHKFSPEQVEHSRNLLGGREPTGAELIDHHSEPAYGVTVGTEDENAAGSA